MSDADEGNETVTDETENTAEQTDETTPADEPQAEEATQQAPAEDAEPVADDAEAVAEVPEAGEPVAEAGEPEPVLSSKERRRRARSTHSGKARPPRTPEERYAERQQERRRNAERRRARRATERAKRAERRAASGPAAPLAPVHAPAEGRRRERQGVVVSSKADKTITVRIDVARRHRRYEKIVRSSTTVKAHDEKNDANEGDIVRVIESRPLSRTKRWALIDVVERAR